MHTAKKIYESDESGVVHVDIPIGRAGRRVEVVVVWSDVNNDVDADVDTDADSEAMAALVGLLEDGDLARPPQGEFEERDSLP
jgi:hypothetical protein